MFLGKGTYSKSVKCTSLWYSNPEMFLADGDSMMCYIVIMESQIA